MPRWRRYGLVIMLVITTVVLPAASELIPLMTHTAYRIDIDQPLLDSGGRSLRRAGAKAATAASPLHVPVSAVHVVSPGDHPLSARHYN